jgi:hypothetical protein
LSSLSWSKGAANKMFLQISFLIGGLTDDFIFFSATLLLSWFERGGFFSVSSNDFISSSISIYDVAPYSEFSSDKFRCYYYFSISQAMHIKSERDVIV